MTKAIFYYALLIVISLLVGACSKKNQKCSIPQASDQENFAKPTEKLITDVYFDSTLSMQGFVQTSSFSYYQQLIPLLERSVINSGGQINFYKFGTVVKEDKLPGRAFREASKPDFYSESNLTSKTVIQNVLDKANTEHLTVIVTDLFQEESDIEILSSKIKEKFIARNLAVGILGIKSQFKGMIYDVGPLQDKFQYEQEISNKMRPFYLLALGKRSDVARYFDDLSLTEMSSFPEIKSLILSSNITEKFSPFAVTETEDIKGLNEVTNVLVENGGQDANFKELTVKSGSTHYLETQIHLQRFPNSTEFSELEAFIGGCSCQTNAIKPNGSDTADQNSSAKVAENIEEIASSALKVNADLINDGEDTPAKNKNKIKLKITVNPERLETQATNCFHISLFAAKNSLPNWVSEWNLSIQQLETWKREKIPFDGSKTYNLHPFLQTLLNLNNPKAADFYLFVK